MQEIEGYKKLDASMANKLMNDDDNALLFNKKQSQPNNAVEMMGTGAIGQSFGGESNLSNLEGLRQELKMLDAKERNYDEFD